MTESDPLHLDTEAGYDRWAEVYDKDGNPLMTLEEPLLRAWLDGARGRRVADVGSGTGRYATWLAQRGAVVDAYDFSEQMAAKALAKPGADLVNWVRHDLTLPLPVDEATYDTIVFALVAEHVENLSVCWQEFARVLKPGGRVVFSALHPAMNLMGISARFFTPDGGQEVRVAGFCHSVSDYVMPVLRSGFKIEEMVERKVDEELAAISPRAEKYLGWPLLLAMHIIKA